MRPIVVIFCLATLINLSLLTSQRASAGTTLIPGRLRCEYRINPLGVDSENPRLDWILLPRNLTARGLYQSSYRIIVASSPALLSKDRGDLWDTGKVISDRTNQILYKGKALASTRQYWWKVQSVDQTGALSTWSQPATWTMGILTPADWQGAKWIGAEQGTKSATTDSLLLRRNFIVRPHLSRAIVYLCGLGQYELTANGSRVGDAKLTPGWTEYDKTVLYDTYDITSLLHSGKNALGILLGNCFYHIHSKPGRYAGLGAFHFTDSGPQQAIGLIRIEYSDGKSQNIVTDTNWKTMAGPITFSSIYGGEDYDARLTPTGWDTSGYDATFWDTPVILSGPGGSLKSLSCSAPPVRSFSVLNPISSKPLAQNVTVYDLGQNASLMVRLKISGQAGSSATIIPTELLNDHGDIFDDLCQGQSYWVYTLAGNGVESYHSKFFYRGGRYLKVQLQPAPGSAELPRVISIAADTIHADSPAVGQFSCSNDRYNKIYSLIRWAQMNNMISVMTDCPTREKLGYLEEDHLNGPALRYNFDISLLTNKIVNDMADSQHENGLVPATAPDYPHWSESGPFAAITTAPGWGSAFIQMPWQQYLFTGDLSHLKTHYEAMKRYVNYLSSRAQDNILKFGLGDWYDNHGAGQPQLTPSAVTDTTFFYQDNQILARAATLLNRPDDARHFEQSAAAILASYNKSFFNPSTSNYSTGSQSANSMPLAMGMVPKESRPMVLTNLVRDFQSKGETAGEVSMQSLIKALAAGGHSDLIYSTFNTDKEGYGLQVKLGKTSLTEGWNGGSSQDHFMFGQINEWFYHDLAGIQQDPTSVGFRKIVIRPSVVGDLTYVNASYDSIQGKIVSDWSRSANKFTMKVTIPIGSTAIVYVPTRNPNAVQESGKPTLLTSGVHYLGRATGCNVYAIGSGNYLFSAPNK